ncbi:MAG: hypothetical protein H6R10_1931 [Rhodocyclaceae bacterium]|nr:hypothetical protein [Rhodocyclaceae bacterium]
MDATGFRRRSHRGGWWKAACWALLCFSPALADQASDLLGKGPIAPAVRRMIDAAPVAASAAALSVAGGSSADDDLPDAPGIPALKSLRLKRLRIDGGGSAGGGGPVNAASPVDIHGGRLEARVTSNLAESIQARIAAPDEGRPQVNPVIKPSGVHVLDVVIALQKPAVDVPDPSDAIDVLQRLRKPVPVEPKVPVKVPDSDLDRLKEAQVSLEDLGKLLPDHGRRIVDNINKVIAPDFAKDIADKARSEVDAPDLLVKLKELVPDQPAAPDIDPRGDINVPDRLPDKPWDMDDNLKALAELEKISVSTISLDDILARIDAHANRPDDPDAIKWGELRDKLKELDPEHIPIQDLHDLVNPRTPDGRPSPHSITAAIADIKARTEAATDRVKERIDVALAKTTATIQGKISGAISVVSQKVNDGLDKAFTELSKVCRDEGAKHKGAADQYAKQAADVKVPPIRYEDCHCRRCGDCLWTSKCCCESCPIPDSVKANADASAKKAAIEAQAKSEQEQSDKFNAAADKVIQKKNEIETSLASVFSDVNKQIGAIDLGPGAVDEGGDDSDGGSSQPGTTTPPRHPHGQSFSEPHLVDRFLKILGDVNLTLQVVDNVNAAIGSNATAIQRIEATGGGMGAKIVLSEMDVDMSIGAVNAAIGHNSYARQVMESLGTTDANQQLGPVRARRDVDGAVNAAIGADSLADMRIASLGGSSPGGVDMTATVIGAVNAAIGYNSDALMSLGNLDGVVGASSRLFLLSTGAVNAAIGAGTESTVRLANLSPSGKIGGSYVSRVVQPGGAIAAAIGYHATSAVGLGNIDGTVQGNANINVASGPVISAAIGGSTTAVNRFGEVGPGGRVSGNLDLNVRAGGATAFAVGASTTARNEVAVIDAPVTGSAKIAVDVGEIVTGTVGANTGATAVVGSVKAPVTGPVDISVNAGGINTFAIGLSTDKTIRSDTYVGSVLQPTTGPVNINVSTGGIFTLGFGLVLDLGIFGTLDFSHQGCTQIGNIGSGC